MKTTLKLLLVIGATLDATGAVYTFKDNTSVKATVFEPASDLAWNKIHGPNESGVYLIVYNKIYIHHYPSYHKRVDNGLYELIPAPPTESGINPLSLPVCAPARIQFMHFSTKTLKKMYFDYHEKVRAEMYKSQPNKNKISKDKKIALAIHKAIHNKNYELNNNFKMLAWQRKVTKEFTGQKSVIWGKYLHERHHFSRR
tara:strand:+ start:438 stop:1034 length:597 start_codon:yes stop_codon:yes gene_type:complete